jgi:hypothetical protein
MDHLPPTIAYRFRQQRADELTARVMSVIGKYLERHDGEACRDAGHALFDLFYGSGVEVISDADRAAAGLLQRDEQGLTPEELQILEARRMQIMLAPMPPVLIRDLPEPDVRPPLR